MNACIAASRRAGIAPMATNSPWPPLPCRRSADRARGRSARRAQFGVDGLQLLAHLAQEPVDLVHGVAARGILERGGGSRQGLGVDIGARALERMRTLADGVEVPSVQRRGNVDEA